MVPAKSTTSDKLNFLYQTKQEIANAIKAKGVDVGPNDTFRSYANKISLISAGIGETSVGNAIKMIDIATKFTSNQGTITDTDYLEENVEIMLSLLDVLVGG